jgi:hypothetical protein
MKLSDFLVEGINYEDMFSKLYSAYEQKGMNVSSLKNTIKETIKDAKAELKREDRIVWFMRLYKIDFIENKLPKAIYEDAAIWPEILKDLKNTAKKANLDLNRNDNRRPAAMLASLSHYLSLPIPKIQNFIFKTQTYQEIWDEFHEYEEEWKKESKGLIAPKDGDKIVVKFDDNAAWWLLARGACREEAEAMGHCGNVPSQKSGERILSFRTEKRDGLWQPHLTFILDKNGKIGEAKGRGNEKPTEKYHPYIAKLLMKGDLITGLKGGGYRPENNFKLSDLDDELREQVLEANPEIKNASMSIWEKYKKFGLTDEVKRQAEEIVYDSRFDSGHIDFDDDGKFVVVDRYNDLEAFVREIDFNLLSAAVKVLDSDDDLDLDEIQKRFYPIADDYRDILERLPDSYLNKVKKSVDYTGNKMHELADLMDKSKYSTELRKAMIDGAIPSGKNFNKDEYMKYVNILLMLYERASENYNASIEEIKSEDDYIVIKMPVDDFFTIVDLIEFDKNNDDIEENENASEDDLHLYYSINSSRSWLPVEHWNLRDSIKELENILDEDDLELFNKYNKYDPSGDEVTGVSQNFDIPIAVKYFTKYIDLNESNTLDRLKILAGL